MRRRIRAVLHASKLSGHTNVVLGAFGCGAFGNPPHETASIFKELLESPEFRGAFKTIVFAIKAPPQGGENFDAFEAVIGTMN